jgi:hypothetical protein
VILELSHAYGRGLSGEFELRFRNLQLHSFDFLKKVQLDGQPLELTGVPAFPTANWNVELFSEKYRFKAVFISVPSSGTADIKEVFFVNPSNVTPVLPTEAYIQTQPIWNALRTVLNQSPIAYGALSDKEKAELLNLLAKMQHSSANNAFSPVINIFKVKAARIYAEVRPELWEMVRSMPQRFHEEPDNGSMHQFEDGWTRLSDQASFKTPDPMGNLQLTFASRSVNRMAVDADLDDHQGLKHAFDLIKHEFSGNTNPYDIHQVLVKFQNIDPGCDFA